MSILRKIVEQKKERVSYAKSVTPLAELKNTIKNIPGPLSFSKAVKRDNSPYTSDSRDQKSLSLQRIDQG